MLLPSVGGPLFGTQCIFS